MTRGLSLTAVLFLAAAALFAQAPAVDVSKLGPQIGQSVPPIAGVDQYARPQTLGSIYGPKGAMLVFFRSADW
ncbi:MAG TPA: hypothetical protein VF491_01360 [Vicinamibacterales bacterium]|jgi:hypothetical protein